MATPPSFHDEVRDLLLAEVAKLRDGDFDENLIEALALLAARAGKHVYVEKPMAMRFEECREIVDVCAQQGVRLYVAFYRRATN